MFQRPLFFVFLPVMASSVVAFAQADEVPMLPTPTATPEERFTRPTTKQTNLPTTEKASENNTKTPEPKVSMKPSAPGVMSITKVVGEIGDQFVTSREVKINSAVEQALDQKPANGEDGYKILTGTERTFPNDVTRVLDEWAVFFEARALGNASVQKADVAKAIGKVDERWAGHQAWKDLEVSSDELKTLVERKLAAQDFQKLKADPALSPVSDDEALSYYKKNRLRFGSLPFSNFQENIKAFLVKTQVEKRLGEWHEVLRRKYKTRNFISG
jgi:hypothetical protein